jgi:hypothetical protein
MFFDNNAKKRPFFVKLFERCYNILLTCPMTHGKMTQAGGKVFFHNHYEKTIA